MSIKNAIEKARLVVETKDGYEVFADADEIRAYLPTQDELDDPMPDIWARRIAACEEILRGKDYPCIFDDMNCCVEGRIDEDGFTFDGKRYKADC